MSNLRTKLVKPYWAAIDDKNADGCPPADDFNREIIHPGTNSRFPEGAIAVRVDDDFWVVAVLPYTYISHTIEEIVAELWPTYFPEAKFNPDTIALDDRKAK